MKIVQLKKKTHLSIANNEEPEEFAKDVISITQMQLKKKTYCKKGQG